MQATSLHAEPPDDYGDEDRADDSPDHAADDGSRVRLLLRLLGR